MNDLEEFLNREVARKEASASMAAMLDDLKKDLVQREWDTSAAQNAATVLANTLLMMTMGQNPEHKPQMQDDPEDDPEDVDRPEGYGVPFPAHHLDHRDACRFHVNCDGLHE